MDCIFCKIVDGELPSKKVFESETVLAFFDITPQAPFHVLVIPKKHIASAAEIDEDNADVMKDIFLAISQIAKENALKNGFRLISNSGKDSGQAVAHLHFHMLAGKIFGTKIV